MAAWRKYTTELLEEAVAASTSIAGVLRYLGLAQAGGSHAHISRTIKKMGLDTSHFRPQARPGGCLLRKPAAEILVLTSREAGRQKPPMLRRALLEIGRPFTCALCGGGPRWRGEPLGLHVDHIDGDFHNNQPDNLRFLCPNCHSQTPTYSGKSKGKYDGSYTRALRQSGTEASNELS